MKPSKALELHRAAIREIVARHNATHPRVFGSVLHGEDTEQSDLDILIDPTPQTTLFDVVRIQKSLRDLLGVEVDVLPPGALPQRFCGAVTQEARPV